jgi:hypothetical protein
VLCVTKTGALSLVLSPQFHSHLHWHREARKIFQPGKNRDGWFTADDLLAQVDLAIDIFEELAGPYVPGLFLFDNAPSHQKRADDAISARQMVKGASLIVIKYFILISCQHRGRDGPITTAEHGCVAVN